MSQCRNINPHYSNLNHENLRDVPNAFPAGYFCCERTTGHSGSHQAIEIFEDAEEIRLQTHVIAYWDNARSHLFVTTIKPVDTCRHCDMLTPAEWNRYCRHCHYWKIDLPALNHIIVDGSAYYFALSDEPTAFKAKFLDAGEVKEITGIFVPAGQVPDEFKFDYPNNGVFKPMKTILYKGMVIPFGEKVLPQDMDEVMDNYEDWS